MTYEESENPRPGTGACFTKTGGPLTKQIPQGSRRDRAVVTSRRGSRRGCADRAFPSGLAKIFGDAGVVLSCHRLVFD
jgi:hypothetical protein